MSASTYAEMGYVCPGKSEIDFVGDNRKSVVKQLKSVGFTEVETVRIVGGLAVWNWGDVIEVMIDGKTNFGAYAYFKPDAKIVVTFI